MRLLLLLLLAAPVLAKTGSFTINLQTDAYLGKTNTTTWSGTRGAATSNASNTSADTLMAAVGFSTPNYLAHRIRLLSDSINADQSTYDDSLNLFSTGDMQIDSAVWSFNLVRVDDEGGCSGYLYAALFDTCVSGTRNYAPTVSGIGLFNDPITPDMATFCTPFWFDSVATTDGQTSGRITFALTDRTVLDEIECIMRLSNSGSPIGIRTEILACYDYSNSDPGTANVYQYKAVVSSLEAAAANRPTLTIYLSTTNAPLFHSQNPFSQYPFARPPFGR